MEKKIYLDGVKKFDTIFVSDDGKEWRKCRFLATNGILAFTTGEDAFGALAWEYAKKIDEQTDEIKNIKKGDIVQASDCETMWYKRIYICEYKGKYLCKVPGEEYYLPYNYIKKGKIEITSNVKRGDSILVSNDGAYWEKKTFECTTGDEVIARDDILGIYTAYEYADEIMDE